MKAFFDEEHPHLATLNPLNHIFGYRIWEHTSIDTDVEWVQMSRGKTDVYLIEFELFRQSKARARGPQWLSGRTPFGWYVQWRSFITIPIAKSGETMFGCDASHFELKPCQLPTWKDAAQEILPRRIGEMRIKNGYMNEKTQ